MLTKNITVELPTDHESRPVALLVQVASQYESVIHMESGSVRANAKSIMGMMAFGLKRGMEVRVTVDGKESSLPAVICFIGRDPLTDAVPSGNPNLSVYPFSASIEPGKAYRQEEVTEVLVPAGEKDEKTVVLPVDWIYYENGIPHVYARAEDGRLVSREVETGRSILGSYLEVLSGISGEDYLADPSGAGVREGALTEAVYGEEMEIGTEEESGGEDG